MLEHIDKKLGVLSWISLRYAGDGMIWGHIKRIDGERIKFRLNWDSNRAYLQMRIIDLRLLEVITSEIGQPALKWRWGFLGGWVIYAWGNKKEDLDKLFSWLKAKQARAGCLGRLFWPRDVEWLPGRSEE